MQPMPHYRESITPRYCLLAARSALVALALCASCNPREPGVTAKRPVAPVMPEVTPTPAQVRRAFWIPGEVMRWRATARGVHFMDITLAVGRPGRVKGQPTIIVRSRYDAAGVVNTLGIEATKEAITWIRLADGKPSKRTDTERFEWRARGKRSKRARETRYEPGAAWVTRVRTDGTRGNPYRRRVPRSGVFDTHSVLGMLRAWNAPEGTYAYFDVFERRLRKHIVRLTRNEMFDTPRGVRPVVRIDARIVSMSSNFGRRGGRGARYTIWITNDADRVPVRIRVPTRRGTLTLDLIDYRRP